MHPRQRPLEVDIARLLLIIFRFAKVPSDETRLLQCWPDHEVTRYLTPEYYLQKLDFLVRYPSYLAYELIELNRLNHPPATDRQSVIDDVRAIFAGREPEIRTEHFRRFLRGAYESIDDVQNWWHSRGLVYTEIEPRGTPGTVARPQKYFFLSPEGEEVAQGIVDEVPAARWYDERIQLIHRYLGSLSPAEVKNLQYAHSSYRDAQLNEWIPDLSLDEVEGHFANVLGVPLDVQHI